MGERKILFFVLAALLYGVYCVNMWFATRNATVEGVKTVKFVPEITSNKTATVRKTKSVPLYLKDACSVLQVFTERPKTKQKKHEEDMEAQDIIAAIGISTFLLILLLNAVLDVHRVKEEERAKMKLNPDGGRRHSLAEFANKKTLRRESTKFSLQLFQIAETPPQDVSKEDKKPRKPYVRGDSINSYLSDKKMNESSSPASADTPAADPKLGKRQSVAKLFGARPVSMARRSSFPALPLNPEIQALMLGSRQSSFDSDDESNKGRRVRIMRRY